MSDLKVVIVDDNPKTRDLIESFLPEYAKGVKSVFGDSAVGAVKAAADGNATDLVVINGEDRKGMSLYLFDWIRNKSGNENISELPVIILIDDEFSDKALDFLEIGDAVFYEGELEENHFFSIFNEALEHNEFGNEVEEPVYSDEKNFDRISGLTVRVKGESDGKRRSAVLDMDRQLENLQAALERGKKKSERIKALLDSASQYKENRKKENADTRPVFLNKIRVEKGLAPVGDVNGYWGDDEEDIPEEFRLHPGKGAGRSNVKEDIKSKISALNGKIKANPFEAAAASGMIGNNSRNAQVNAQTNANQAGSFGMPGLNMSGMMAANQQMTNPSANMNANVSNQKIIVVVDDEEKELKTCELFLGRKYKIVTFDNGRKAIDYFIRNTADLILIDTYMPSLGGAQTLASVRWQANGRSVPAIYMYDRTYPVAMETLKGEGVVGIIQKPLSAGGLAVAVDGFFRNMR